ncbi:hypothetical protein D3C72_628740 [compost metagenome]
MPQARGATPVAPRRRVSGDRHYRCIQRLYQPPRGPLAGPGLCQRIAVGLDQRNLAGLGDRGRRAASGNRFPHPGRHGLHHQVPLGPAGGPLRAALAGPPPRLDAGDPAAAGAGHHGDGGDVAVGRADAPGLAGGVGGLPVRHAGHCFRRLLHGRAAQGRTGRGRGHQGHGVPAGDDRVGRPGADSCGPVDRVGQYLRADGGADAAVRAGHVMGAGTRTRFAPAAQPARGRRRTPA